MCKFVQIIYNPGHNLFANLHYVPKVQACYSKYVKYLHDDFVNFESDIYRYLEHCFPYIWAITTYDDQFMGFVSLDNLVGGKICSKNGNIEDINYSAELTTCFEKQAWGIFTRYSAKFFLKKCFDELGLYKIKAQIYPDNSRIATLLKSSGFEYETTLKSETLRNGKPQDIDVYGLYRNYYYKTR